MTFPAEADSPCLVLMRHGQSEWNARNLFTGWADPGLTAEGKRQAMRAGRLLADRQLLPGLAHTSLQRRAICSTELVLAACGRGSIPVRRSWRLNGRHMGSRSSRGDGPMYAAPPPCPAGSAPPGAVRYPQVRPEDEPRSESLHDVTARLLPYWHDAVVADLRTGATVLIVSHGNTLRALVKYLDAIGDDEVAELDIPNGIPLVYRLGSDMRPLSAGGSYLAG
jgi:2,3-bisphosphoglycerate-dependent phosphoglycerate mutase